MLTIITGRAKSGKTEELFKLLKNNAASFEESLLFVPEQFSFNAEKMVINNCSDDLNKITVVSFTSFSNEIKRLYGGNSGKVINDSTRIMFLNKAIRQLNGELKLFKTSSSAINSIDTIISAITELKQSAVSYQQLIEISKLYDNTLLGMKLHDIALIMSTYDALIKNTYIDPLDELEIAYTKAQHEGYFCDKAVYFDSFSGFTGQQYKVIKQALIDSKNVVLSLCTDNKDNGEFGIFSNVNDTIQNVIKIANNVNIKDINRVHLENCYFENPSLAEVEKYVAEINTSSCDLNDVHFKSAGSKYSELEFIATEIHRLVREENYRFRDFAVITGNSESYTLMAEAIFEKLEVPIYTDKKISLIDTPIANFILSALRAAKNYSTAELLKYIKTNLTDMDENDIAELEAYTYLWNIKSAEWNDVWQKNPYGLNEISEEKQVAKLEYLNSLREKAIKPIRYFNYVKKAPSDELCRNTFLLLESCNVADNLANCINNMNGEGDYNNTQYIISSWEAAMTVLDSIVDCYGTEELSLIEFINLLEISFKNYSLGGIPQGLDEVYFASANRTERNDFKIVFVFALNYGEFPSFSADSGLFNIVERGKLIGNGIEINDTYIGAAIDENYFIYKALTSANNALYMLYHYGDYSGKSSEPSMIMVQLAKHFSKKIEVVQNNIIETKSQAFSKLSENELSVEDSKRISNILAFYPYWSNKLELLTPSNNIITDTITSVTAKKLYGGNTTTSASKIEQYFKCPYAYFLKFGLNIKKPLQIDFKRMQRGQIVHYVLERFIKENLQNFSSLDYNNLEEIINAYIDDYIAKNVGGKNLLDAYSKYILKRILELLLDLVPSICEELINSEFKPVAFEYDLNSDDIESIEIGDGNGSVRINGVIDRFDMCEIDGEKFIRIVDYKTGGKKIRLADILYGLNLQMFIYISAICESEKFRSIPAGVLYQPINHVVRKGINAEITDKPTVSAVLTSNVEVLKHMDPTESYMPFKITNSGTADKRSLCVSNSDFTEIFRYIKNKIIKMNDEILSGRIEKDPCDSDSSHNTCDYCDYNTICQRNKDISNKVVPNISTEEALDIIAKENGL